MIYTAAPEEGEEWTTEMLTSITLPSASEWKANLMVLYRVLCGCLVTADAAGVLPSAPPHITVLCSPSGCRHWSWCVTEEAREDFENKVL